MRLTMRAHAVRVKLWASLFVFLAFAPPVRAQPAPVASVNVQVMCADHNSNMTPAGGLELSIDGVRRPEGRVAETIVGYEYECWGHHRIECNNVPITDSRVVYDDVAPGFHHLELSAPDCASSTDVVALKGEQLELVGRLALAHDWLRGTATLPNGFTLELGGYAAWRPAYAYPSGASAYGYRATEGGGMFSLGRETRHMVFELDQMYGGGGGSVNAPDANPVGRATAVTPLGSTFVWDTALRVGGRLAYRDASFAAGTGIGVDLVEDENLPTDLAARQGTGGHFVMPFWASLTYKPTCSWGVRVTGTYEVHPSAMDETAPMLSAGLIWQRSAACSETPHVVEP